MKVLVCPKYRVNSQCLFRAQVMLPFVLHQTEEKELKGMLEYKIDETDWDAFAVLLNDLGQEVSTKIHSMFVQIRTSLTSNIMRRSCQS